MASLRSQRAWILAREPPLSYAHGKCGSIAATGRKNLSACSTAKSSHEASTMRKSLLVVIAALPMFPAFADADKPAALVAARRELEQ
jgi:hypothetical protein